MFRFLGLVLVDAAAVVSRVEDPDIRYDTVVTIIIAADDPSVSQSVFTITEKAPTMY